jgi:hypothetical protein
MPGVDLARMRQWLRDGDTGQRCAAADALALEADEGSVAALGAQLLRESDPWVFALILDCLLESRTEGAGQQILQVGEALVDPYLKFVFLNAALRYPFELPPSLLRRFADSGPWFVELIAAALLKQQGDDVDQIISVM